MVNNQWNYSGVDNFDEFMLADIEYGPCGPQIIRYPILQSTTESNAQHFDAVQLRKAMHPRSKRCLVLSTRLGHVGVPL